MCGGVRRLSYGMPWRLKESWTYCESTALNAINVIQKRSRVEVFLLDLDYSGNA